MILIAGSTCGSKIEADIESLGLAGFPEESLGMEGKIPDIEHLVGGESIHEGGPD